VAGIEIKRFDDPDEHRAFEGKGGGDIVKVFGQTIGRGTFEPGWKWSVNVKPIAGTDLCQFTHLNYIVSGRMRLTLSDGSQHEVSAGDVVGIPPGHDAEVIGDETVVTIDVAEFKNADFAKRG
jgi:hypothetical protein